MDLRILWGSLPRTSRLFLIFSRGLSNEPVIKMTPADLKREGIEVSRKYAKLFQKSTRDVCGRQVPFDQRQVFVVSRGKRNATTISTIRLSYGTPVRLGLNLIMPKGTQGAYEFDVVRVSGKKILGGVTYRMNVKSS